MKNLLGPDYKRLSAVTGKQVDAHALLIHHHL